MRRSRPTQAMFADGVTFEISLQTADQAKHRKNRYQPHHFEHSPDNDLTPSAISGGGAMAVLDLDLAVPFADDAFAVVLHRGTTSVTPLQCWCLSA